MSLPLLIGVMIAAIAGGNLGARLARSGSRAGQAAGAPLDRVSGSVRSHGPSDRSERHVD